MMPRCRLTNRSRQLPKLYPFVQSAILSQLMTGFLKHAAHVKRSPQQNWKENVSLAKNTVTIPNRISAPTATIRRKDTREWTQLWGIELMACRSVNNLRLTWTIPAPETILTLTTLLSSSSSSRSSTIREERKAYASPAICTSST